MNKTLLIIIIFIITLVSCNSRIELPFTLTENNRIVFDANVNGKQGKYFWDTGAYASHANCNMENLEPAYNGSTAMLNDSDNLSYYTLNQITISGVEIKSVSEVTRITDSLKRKILDIEGLDGMLGINVFEGYWCEVRFSDNKVILHKKKPSGYASSIKTELDNNYLLVNINIDDIQTRFYIDTGDPLTLRLPDSITHRKNIDKLSKVLASNTYDYYLIPVANTTVLDKELNNVIIPANSHYRQVTLSGGTGLIGLNFLKNYNLLLDLTQLRSLKTSDIYYSVINKKLYCFDILPRIPDSGIVSYYVVEDGIIISGIIKDSRLNLLGCGPNTLIIELNNRSIFEFEPQEIHSSLFSMVGLQSLTVLDKSNERIINIE